METKQSQPRVSEIIDYVKSLSPCQCSIMSEVCTLVKLILVSPATNAVSERSASGLRRVKTYLRSTMSEKRLNSLMVLDMYKDRTDQLDLEQCLNEFIAGNELRNALFGLLKLC